jgi:crotonobetainyl-CoA:carnitine CoA-transferase CaiB-like acyl-CoA transferase
MTGKGQHVDLSQQEALLNLVRLEISAFNTGWVESRSTRSFPVAGLMPCRNGFVQVMPLFKPMWEGLVDLIGNPEWAQSQKFEDLLSGFYSGDKPSGETQQEVNERLAKWMLEHDKEEIYYGGQERGVGIGIVCSVEDLAKSRQLKAREFFVEVEHPETGPVKHPSAPYKLSETPWRVERPAPRLGQDNFYVYCERLGYTRRELVHMHQAGII